MVNKYRKGINFGRLILLFLVLEFIVFLLTGCVSKTESPNVASGNNSFPEQTELIEEEASHAETSSSDSNKPEMELILDKDGFYTSKEDVSLYIHLYGTLLSNFKKTSTGTRMEGWFA